MDTSCTSLYNGKVANPAYGPNLPFHAQVGRLACRSSAQFYISTTLKVHPLFSAGDYFGPKKTISIFVRFSLGPGLHRQMRPASKFAYWNVDAKHSLIVSQGYIHRVAQLFGTDVSIVISVALYVVFSTAYPRINDLTRATWAFSTPEVPWRAVVIAMSSTTLSIPLSSVYTTIALRMTTIMSVVPNYQRFLQDTTSLYRKWSWSCY